jgi:hypothetical protein
MNEFLVFVVGILIYWIFFKATLVIDLYFIWRGFDAKYRTECRFERAGMPRALVGMVKRLER